MEKETCTFSFCKKPAIEEVETDLLLIGGGMACCGAAFEAARWANPKKIKVTMVDKAATDRSGAVAMGLSAINTYMGDNDPSTMLRWFATTSWASSEKTWFMISAGSSKIPCSS